MMLQYSNYVDVNINTINQLEDVLDNITQDVEIMYLTINPNILFFNLMKVVLENLSFNKLKLIIKKEFLYNQDLDLEIIKLEPKLNHNYAYIYKNDTSLVWEYKQGSYVEENEYDYKIGILYIYLKFNEIEKFIQTINLLNKWVDAKYLIPIDNSKDPPHVNKRIRKQDYYIWYSKKIIVMKTILKNLFSFYLFAIIYPLNSLMFRKIDIE